MTKKIKPEMRCLSEENQFSTTFYSTICPKSIHRKEQSMCIEPPSFWWLVMAPQRQNNFCTRCPADFTESDAWNINEVNLLALPVAIMRLKDPILPGFNAASVCPIPLSIGFFVGSAQMKVDKMQNFAGYAISSLYRMPHTMWLLMCG